MMRHRRVRVLEGGNQVKRHVFKRVVKELLLAYS
jgi:hypothetical protein